MDSETKKQLQDLQKNEAKENRKCIDCGALSPVYLFYQITKYTAMGKYGIMFCLECSGVHRSLGITMDKWSQDQIKKMQFGGNKKCMDFFKSHPDWRENMTIQEKYSSEFAKQYKEKLTAECDGRIWSPTPKGSPKLSRPATLTSPSSHLHSPSLSNSKTNQQPTSFSSGDFKTPAQQQAISDRQKNEEYFRTKGNDNDKRPDNLPPSQGGKFQGFDNPDPQPTSTDPFTDPLAALSKGWSFFSSTALTALQEGTKIAISSAEVIGQKVHTNVIQPTTKSVRENNSLNLDTINQALYESFGKVKTGVDYIVKEGKTGVDFIVKEGKTGVDFIVKEGQKQFDTFSYGDVGDVDFDEVRNEQRKEMEKKKGGWDWKGDDEGDRQNGGEEKKGGGWDDWNDNKQLNSHQHEEFQPQIPQNSSTNETQKEAESWDDWKDDGAVNNDEKKVGHVVNNFTEEVVAPKKIEKMGGVKVAGKGENGWGEFGDDW